MTGSGNRDEQDEGLSALLAAGFAARGELIPTSEAEVERAEAELLAAESASSRARASVASTRRWPGLLAAAAVGALLSSAVHGWFARPRAGTPAIAGEGQRPVPSAAVPKKASLVDAVPACTACCGGSRCASARPELASCSSRRQCVACSAAASEADSFRVRLGNLALSPLAAKQRDETHSTGPLEMCVRAGSSEERCVAADLDGKPWSELSLVVSAPQLLAGFELRVRQRGAPDYLAKWATPIVVSADVLCRGIVAKPQVGPGEVWGTASVFLDDTEYVELGRSAQLDALQRLAAGFELGALQLAAHETRVPGGEHFALALGPFDHESAERLRARALGAGASAKITVGADFVGEPLALP